MTLRHDALQRADKFVHDLPVIKFIHQPTYKDTLAVAYWHLSLEHHAGLVTLLQDDHYTPAFALFRPQMDAHLRGLWARRIVTEERLRAFMDGDETIYPTARHIILKHPIEDERKHLLAQHDTSWAGLCDLTHGGALQMRARLAPGDMQTHFSDDMVASCIDSSISLAFLSLLEISEALSDEPLMKSTTDRYYRLYPEKKAH